MYIIVPTYIYKNWLIVRQESFLIIWISVILSPVSFIWIILVKIPCGFASFNLIIYQQQWGGRERKRGLWLIYIFQLNLPNQLIKKRDSWNLLATLTPFIFQYFEFYWFSTTKFNAYNIVLLFYGNVSNVYVYDNDKTANTFYCLLYLVSSCGWIYCLFDFRISFLAKTHKWVFLRAVHNGLFFCNVWLT